MPDALQRATHHLQLISDDVRSAGDVPLVRITEDGAGRDTITLADELWLVKLQLEQAAAGVQGLVEALEKIATGETYEPIGEDFDLHAYDPARILHRGQYVRRISPLQVASEALTTWRGQ